MGHLNLNDAPSLLYRTGLALIAQFENDIRRERQMDGVKHALERGVKFGRKPLVTEDVVAHRMDGAAT